MVAWLRLLMVLHDIAGPVALADKFSFTCTIECTVQGYRLKQMVV